MVDQLAADYQAAGQPVVILEQNIQHGWLGDGIRLNRFLTAAPWTSYAYPMVIVDSGHQVTQGSKSDYYTAYKRYIDYELARPSKGDISGTYWRVGNHIETEMRITNRSGVTLSAANDATAFVIVYEDVTPYFSVNLTSRRERAVVYQSIAAPLENGASTTLHISTPDLSAGAVWKNLHTLFFVDYRPGGSTGAYDMIQAALAEGPALSVQPAAKNFTVASPNLSDPEFTLTISGTPDGMPWSVTSKPAWVTVLPAAGSVGDTTQVRVRVSGLQQGANRGVVVITTGYAPAQSREVTIQVDYNPSVYLQVSPGELNFLIDPLNPSNTTAQLTVSGYPADLSWSVASTSKPGWVTVTPPTGIPGATPVVEINLALLAPGENNGLIRFAASDSSTTLIVEVPVHVFYSAPKRCFIPLVSR